MAVSDHRYRFQVPRGTFWKFPTDSPTGPTSIQQLFELHGCSGKVEQVAMGRVVAPAFLLSYPKFYHTEFVPTTVLFAHS